MSTLHHLADVTVSYTAAIDDNIGQTISDKFLGILRPIILVGAVGLALYFLAVKQFSRIWYAVGVGAVVYMLTIGNGDTSIIARIANWVAGWF